MVGKIYEAKAANEQSNGGSKPASPYYPQAKYTSPVSTSLPDFAKSGNNTKQNSNETVTLGKAGQTALGEIIKPDPDVFGTRSGYLYAAYQAGLSGQDFSRELRADAAAGNFLDEIETMYKAGETDAKIAEGDVIFDEDVPYMGAAPNADTAGSNKNINIGNTTAKNNTISNSTEQYQIGDSEKELNYMTDMLFMNGAASSADPSVQEAYQWLMNPNKKMDSEKV